MSHGTRDSGVQFGSSHRNLEISRPWVWSLVCQVQLLLDPDPRSQTCSVFSLLLCQGVSAVPQQPGSLRKQAPSASFEEGAGVSPGSQLPLPLLFPGVRRIFRNKVMLTSELVASVLSPDD